MSTVSRRCRLGEESVAGGGGQQQLRWKRSSAHMLGGAAGGSRRQHTWQAGDVLAHGKKGRVGVQLLSGACCNNLSEVGSSRQRQQQQQNEQETKTSRRTLPKLRTAHAVPIAFFNYFQQFSLSLSRLAPCCHLSLSGGGQSPCPCPCSVITQSCCPLLNS